MGGCIRKSTSSVQETKRLQKSTHSDSTGQPSPSSSHLSNKPTCCTSGSFSSFDVVKYNITSNPLPLLPPPNLNPNQIVKFCRALYDFGGRTVTDLQFQRGDILGITNDVDNCWWYARHMKYNKEGFVPSNYVEEIMGNDLWYFGNIKRIEAEEMLMKNGNDVGSFLVRDSESQANDYSLSIRDFRSVKHYRIRYLDGVGFYITPNAVFPSLASLIENYIIHPTSLCAQLIRPCSRPPESNGNDGNISSFHDIWEIPKSSIRLSCKIGQGQFGDVYEGVWNDSVRVAVKTLKCTSAKVDSSDFMAEAQIMKRLRHQHLIQLYAISTESKPFYIITELMSRGNLLTYLRTERPYLRLSDLISFACQVASGMAYLESQGFIHRDLAARNILVNEFNVVKVADFGLARVVKGSDYEAKAGARFPIKWTAPEAVKFNRFSIESDVWSFGVLLMEIITFGEEPYKGMVNAQVLEFLSKGYRMAKPLSCPDPLYEIMTACWSDDQSLRPSFGCLEIVLSEFAEQLA